MKKVFLNTAAVVALLLPPLFAAHAQTPVLLCDGVEVFENSDGSWTVRAGGGEFVRTDATIESLEQEFCQPD